MNKTALLLSLAALALPLYAAESDHMAQSNEEIAKKLSNPIAHIINVPFQMNWDYGGGVKDDGQRYYLQVNPVIPYVLNDDWAIVARTVMLFEERHNFGYGSKGGLGDFTQSLFLAPTPKPGKLIWGAGPVVLMPTATDTHLGSGKWGAGPSVILVKELEKWTFGLLASHTWSFAGQSSRDYVSATFLQPFVARHLPGAVTVTATSEYTYDWHDHEQSFPLNLMLAKVVRIGKMPVSFSVGGRYYADKPSGGPDWGLRAMVTFVLPGFR